MPRGDAQQACLILIFPPEAELGRRIDLQPPSLTLGRQSDAGLRLDDDHASRLHARLEWRDSRWVVVDLDSKNGTFVNGERVSDQLLGDGDLLVVGSTIFKFLTGANVELAYHKELYRLTVVDTQTRAYNKRYFQEQLSKAVAQTARTGRPLSLVLFDVDHFKRINDTHGHPTGDEVLRELVGRAMRQIRGTDLLARYGGEEFALLLPDTAVDGAVGVAERLVSAVEKTPFVVKGRAIRVTISVGVAASEVGMEEQDLVKLADDNMYRAKREGRNRVIS
jgi:two-component system, cell cycle response regulator